MWNQGDFSCSAFYIFMHMNEPHAVNSISCSLRPIWYRYALRLPITSSLSTFKSVHLWAASSCHFSASSLILPHLPSTSSADQIQTLIVIQRPGPVSSSHILLHVSSIDPEVKIELQEELSSLDAKSSPGLLFLLWLHVNNHLDSRLKKW